MTPEERKALRETPGCGKPLSTMRHDFASEWSPLCDACLDLLMAARDAQLKNPMCGHCGRPWLDGHNTGCPRLSDGPITQRAAAPPREPSEEAMRVAVEAYEWLPDGIERVRGVLRAAYAVDRAGASRVLTPEQVGRAALATLGGAQEHFRRFTYEPYRHPADSLNEEGPSIVARVVASLCGEPGENTP